MNYRKKEGGKKEKKKERKKHTQLIFKDQLNQAAHS
jgi:hypothetical protein